MKQITKTILLCLALLMMGMGASAQGLKAFKLRNGLSVFIWEDESKPDVFGLVGVRAGSINEPSDYTGLAHYLEHVMFKGTTLIGSLDWAQEEPLYKEIIAKYDLLAAETDPAKRQALSKEINELSVKAGEYGLPNEYSNLMESIGATGVNAGTSYDYTYYHSSFPPYQVNKWLEISSQRFLNPVFRSFQSELENVYEEYNRSQDSESSRQSEFMLKQVFAGHPYSRSVIGLPEHLKNPQLSKLMEFYETWYVPENMVLVLVGNIKAQQVVSRINASFGRLTAKPMPERIQYPDLDIKGRKEYTLKHGSYPQLYLIYKGVPAGHPDEDALDIAMSLLNNGNQTGTIDKLVLDGEISDGGAGTITFREQGRLLVNCIPLYDENQRRYASNKSTEKRTLEAIQKIANGEFEEWKINAIKNEMCRRFDLMMEDNESIGNLLMNAFYNEQDLEEVLNYKDKIMAISTEDIKRVAKQYLNDNFIAIHIEQGKESKGEKIEKPGYKPVEPPVGKQSLYATQFKNMPMGKMEEKFIDFSDVQVRQLNDHSKMYYTPNTENNIFQLVVQYGVGTQEMPKLGIAASLMNNAGVMGAYKPQELKEELSKLNATCQVTADDNYLYIIMQGYEETLPDVCRLVSRQILMPEPDEKQLNRQKSMLISNRLIRTENVSALNSALQEYLMYGENSEYLTELTDKEVYYMDIASLKGDLTRAANYEAKIFYTGTLPFDDAYTILSQNLPLVANERPSNSPQVREMAQATENTIFFLPNNDAEQAQIHFYLPMQAADKKDDVLRDAFNQYFGVGFTGLVLNEIREKRSMAYTAYAQATTQGISNKASCLIGYIGTQNDKANEAVEVFMGLVNDMPEYSDRIDNIKSYLRQEALTSHPSFRSKAMSLVSLELMGYTDDPAKENLAKIDALTFEDIVKFYKENIQGKPYRIAIMGNPKMIDLKALEKFGKVVKLSEKRLFNSKDKLF